VVFGTLIEWASPYEKGTSVKTALRRSIGALALVATLALASGGPTQAQDQFEQVKLESFVTAAITVNELIEQWTPRINGAQNEAEAAELRDEANAELAAAIEQTNGITVEEYREISQAVRGDPQLAARITEIYQDRVAQ
jgi:predicted secreted protein